MNTFFFLEKLHTNEQQIEMIKNVLMSEIFLKF